MNMQLALFAPPPPTHCGPIGEADQVALLKALERLTEGDCVDGLAESLADFTGMAAAEAQGIARLFYRVVRDARVARANLIEDPPAKLRRVVRP